MAAVHPEEAAHLAAPPDAGHLTSSGSPSLPPGEDSTAGGGRKVRLLARVAAGVAGAAVQAAKGGRLPVPQIKEMWDLTSSR